MRIQASYSAYKSRCSASTQDAFLRSVSHIFVTGLSRHILAGRGRSRVLGVAPTRSSAQRNRRDGKMGEGKNISQRIELIIGSADLCTTNENQVAAAKPIYRIELTVLHVCYVLLLYSSLSPFVPHSVAKALGFGRTCAPLRYILRSDRIIRNKCVRYIVIVITSGCETLCFCESL